MYTIQQNEASAAERRIPFALIDRSTNLHVDNVNFNVQSLKVSKNGGTPVTAAGSAFQVASPMSGVYYYQASTAEVDTPGFMTLMVSAGSAYPQWPTVQIVRAVNISGGAVEARLVDISAGVGPINATVVSMSAGVIGSTTIAASAIASTRINGTLPVNTIQINSTTVSGVGTSANPWGPA